MTWDWGYAWETLPQLLDGLGVTVLATLAGTAIALVLGLIFTVLRRSSSRWICIPTEIFVEFIRSTPLLVQLFVLFFVLPEAGIQLSAFMTGVIGLGLHYATYTSEVYRSGIEGVPAGQWEAAKALNLPSRRVWTSVILPQAVPPSIPALGNYAIAMFKETPQLTVITVMELLSVARQLGAENYRYLEPVTIIGVLFLLLSLPTAWLVRRMERRLVPAPRPV